MLEYDVSIIRPMEVTSSLQLSSRWMFVAEPMLQAVGNFLSGQEEVTMTARRGSFKMKNYVDVGDKVKSQQEVQTELTMTPEEFELYDISKVRFILNVNVFYN